MVSFDRSNNTGSIDVKMDGSGLKVKSSFKDKLKLFDKVELKMAPFFKKNSSNLLSKYSLINLSPQQNRSKIYPV